MHALISKYGSVEPLNPMFFATLIARATLEAVAEENPNTGVGRTAKRLIRIGNLIAWSIVGLFALLVLAVVLVW